MACFGHSVPSSGICVGSRKLLYCVIALYSPHGLHNTEAQPQCIKSYLLTQLTPDTRHGLCFPASIPVTPVGTSVEILGDESILSFRHSTIVCRFICKFCFMVPLTKTFPKASMDGLNYIKQRSLDGKKKCMQRFPTRVARETDGASTPRIFSN